jgi:hypothetical protein
MSNQEYIILNIKIDLDGDIKEKGIEYNYSVNTNPESKKSTIFIPRTAYIGDKDAFITSNFSKNPIEIFLSTTNLIDFLRDRPQIFKKQSELLYNQRNKLHAEIRKLENEKIFGQDNDKDINDLKNQKKIINNHIYDSNLKLILPLLFKKNDIFYFKDDKYKIIKNYTINTDVSNNISEKNISEQELLANLENDKSESIYNNSNEQLIYNLKHKRYNNINDDTIKLLFEQNLTPAIREQIKKAIKRYREQIKADADKEAKEYIEKNKKEIFNTIVKNMNEEEKRKKSNIKYEYIKFKGIVATQYKNQNDITIKLTVRKIYDKVKDKITAENIIYNCKTRKKRIKDLYHELFDIKSLKSTLDFEAEGFKLYYLDIKSQKNMNEIYSDWKNLSNSKKQKYIDIAQIIKDNKNMSNDNDESIKKISDEIERNLEGQINPNHIKEHLEYIMSGFKLFCKYKNKELYNKKKLDIDKLYQEYSNLLDKERNFYIDIADIAKKYKSGSGTQKNKINIKKYYNFDNINYKNKLDRLKAMQHLLRQQQMHDFILDDDLKNNLSRDKFMINLLNKQ